MFLLDSRWQQRMDFAFQWKVSDTAHMVGSKMQNID